MEGVLWWGFVLAIILVVVTALRREADEEGGGETDDSSEAREPPALFTPGMAAQMETMEREMELEPSPEPGCCRFCNTENDPFYTYCRECVSRLP
ncbi:hypothetical protein CV102_19600 [Natronococcus pandeyae]|uniref:DUF7577 domain-containing protein n=1 Tax=Natronococcus pandeyae TaxID=2055836 RepID=A0A8J8Q4F0_9EURY|nr:hypothetical protein [Natronococcus pandeyae]TYL36960.1 hypothetical protein CV102_19600 [Natronococcus pandeyae]